MFSRQVGFQLEAGLAFPVLLDKMSFIPMQFAKARQSVAAARRKSRMGKSEPEHKPPRWSLVY